MIHSPLILDRYYFSRIEVTATSDGKQELGRLSTSIKVDRSVGDEPEHWRVALRVQQPEDKDRPTYYLYDVVVVGFFRVRDSFPKESVTQLVHINGPSILFGFIRELLSTITAKGPHEPVILPLVSFADAKIPDAGISKFDTPAKAAVKRAAAAKAIKKPAPKRAVPRTTAAK